MTIDQPGLNSRLGSMDPLVLARGLLPAGDASASLLSMRFCLLGAWTPPTAPQNTGAMLAAARELRGGPPGHGGRRDLGGQCTAVSTCRWAAQHIIHDCWLGGHQVDGGTGAGKVIDLSAVHGGVDNAEFFFDNARAVSVWLASELPKQRRTANGGAPPSSRVAQELAQQLLVLLLHEASLDAQARVGKVLAHIVVDLLGPHAPLALLEEALDAFSSGLGRVAADVLALARGRGAFPVLLALVGRRDLHADELLQVLAAQSAVLASFGRAHGRQAHALLVVAVVPRVLLLDTRGAAVAAQERLVLLHARQAAWLVLLAVGRRVGAVERRRVLAIPHRAAAADAAAHGDRDGSAVGRGVAVVVVLVGGRGGHEPVEWQIRTVGTTRIRAVRSRRPVVAYASRFLA
ncbi:hypothetical protein ON010_g6342 [Phytophthora cinnamomi]|nr:hypothetical protein ON010_g6342 [Phytophthora cinnamomi]